MIFGIFVLVLLLAIGCVLVGLPVAFGRWLQLPSGRVVSGVAISVSIILAAGTSVFMDKTLRQLARRASQPIRGLILRPVPNTGGDHEYTPKGREYERTAFLWPFCAGSAVLLLLGLCCTALAPVPRGAAAVSIWSAIIAAIGFMFLFWVFREFTAWDIFI